MPHFEIARYPAITDKFGWKGLNRTMLDLFRHTKDDLLVFEDDATWMGTTEDYYNTVAQLPTGWDMLHFGANIKSHRLERVSANIVRHYGAWTTHAVLYSADFCRHMAETFDPESLVIDEYFRTQIHPLGNSYVSDPFLSFQRPSVSDLEKAMKDYTDVFKDSARRVKAV
jgi:hypothetical protein